uniref:Apolipoprotein D-like n=1 Tax=Ciona intestinalis TaxID=7719 RepID=F6QCG4_CIOIN|nr:apolipoprotein D-like [Ciona intestinalis]|eukprot:XP_009858014.1 apolipoprotein D-like [Ciona intestinalis]
MHLKQLCLLFTVLGVVASTPRFVSPSVRTYCPNVTVATNFTMNDLVGTWYEVSRTPNQWELGKCTRVHHILSENGTEISLHWEQLVPNRWELEYSYALSIARHIPGLPSANLLLQFIQQGAYPMPYTILDIVPGSYYVAHTCYAFPYRWYPGGFLYVEMAWVMSRTPYMNPISRELRRLTLEQSGVITSWMKNVDQNNCAAAYRELGNNTFLATNGDRRKTA